MSALIPSPRHERLPAWASKLEARVLLVQCAIAVSFCAGAELGWYGVSGPGLAAGLGAIVAYHACLAVYVLFFRLPGRPIVRVERFAPICDVICVTIAWSTLGDPDSAIWAVYLCLLIGRARRVHGSAYAIFAAFVAANLVAGHSITTAMAGRTTVDAMFAGNLFAMIAITGSAAVLSYLIGTAWQVAEHDARQLAGIDPLTGLANRRAFIEQLSTIGDGSDRQFAVLMLDLDDFKGINDEFGHKAGDDVLVRTCQLLMTNTRPGDIVGRYGGEEFIIALPDAGDVEAVAIAERLREKVAIGSPVTVSVGCTVRTGDEPAEIVIQRADGLLMTAKRTGKNRVIADGPRGSFVAA